MRFYFREATKNLLKTYPFILLRLLVGFLLGLGLLVGLLGAVWVWMVFGDIAGVAAGLVVLVLIVLFGIILQPYLLYLVDGGHVAVLTEIITTGETPPSQIRFGLAQVKANFGSVTLLFVIYFAIKQVLKQVNSLINAIVGGTTERLSSSGRQKEAGVIQGLAGIVQLALNITIGYVDKAILANIYRSDEENNWKPAKDGVVLYIKTWKPILASALILATVAYLPFLIAAVFYEEILSQLGGEEAVIEWFESLLLGFSDVGLIVVVVVFLAVLGILHLGIVKPFLTSLIVTIYLNETEGVEPVSEWESRLREQSAEYRSFERRAAGEEDAEKTGTWRDYILP